MNWTIYVTAACGGLAIGAIIGWVLTELRYYNRFQALKEHADAQLDEIRQAVCANILLMAESAKRKLTDAVAEFGDKPEMTAIRDSFVGRLDEALVKAAGNPILLARIAKEGIPPMLVAAGNIEASLAETRRMGETYDRLVKAVVTMSADFWKLVRAVIGQGTKPDELEAVGTKLAAAHRAFGEEGLAVGLTKLTEAFAEMSRLTERHLPGQPDEPRETN